MASDRSASARRRSVTSIAAPRTSMTPSEPTLDTPLKVMLIHRASPSERTMRCSVVLGCPGTTLEAMTSRMWDLSSGCTWRRYSFVVGAASGARPSRRHMPSDQTESPVTRSCTSKTPTRDVARTELHDDATDGSSSEATNAPYVVSSSRTVR